MDQAKVKQLQTKCAQYMSRAETLVLEIFLQCKPKKLKIFFSKKKKKADDGPCVAIGLDLSATSAAIQYISREANNDKEAIVDGVLVFK